MGNKDFITRLDETTNNILQIVNKSTINQINWKQDENWNIMEIIEHLYLTDKVIYTIFASD